MGNCFVCLSSRSVHDAQEEDPSIKVVRLTDGEVFEYPGPVYVRDLMFGFEGYAVFHQSTAKQPLPPDTQLKMSEIYYVKPLISLDELSEKHLNDSKSWGIDGERVDMRPKEEKSVEKQERKAKKVRFLDEEESRPAEISSSVSELAARSSSLSDFSPACMMREQSGVVRLKLVMSKRQLSELMATASCNKEMDIDVVEGIIAPLLSQKNAPGMQITTGSLSPIASCRKPWLEKISEG